MLLKLKEAYK